MALKVIDIVVKNADIGSCGKFYPYIIIKVEKKLFKTRKSHQVYYPIWNCDCSFLLLQKSTPNIQFFIYDSSDDSLMGEATLTYEEVSLSPKKEYCVPLQNISNIRTRKGYVLNGAIYVQAEINNLVSGMLADYGTPLLDFHLRLRPGDIVLLSHARIDGVLVSAGTASRWNHVGIIIPGNGDNMMFFEATVDGVSISNLEDCLLGWRRSLPGITFGFRRLTNVNPLERVIMEEKLKSFAQQNVDKPYESNIIDIAKALFNANRKEDYSSFFCSELVAACWKKIGLLSQDKISSNYFPSTFGKRNFTLEQGVILSDIIYYKDWPDPEKHIMRFNDKMRKSSSRTLIPTTTHPIKVPPIYERTSLLLPLSPRIPENESEPAAILLSARTAVSREKKKSQPALTRSSREHRKSMEVFSRLRRPFSHPSDESTKNV